MAFRPPPAIVQRVMRFKAIKHEDGKFLIFGNPAFIDPIYVQVYYHKLVEKKCGDEANRIRYYTAKLQAMIGTKIINERFGYAKTIPDKEKLTEFNQGQPEIMGLGQFQRVRMDFKNNLFIYSGRSPYAEEYKRFFGPQKGPVDYWLMGMWAGAFEAITNKKMLCIEKRCVAAGSKTCEFVIKPVKDWEKSELKKYEFLLKEAESMEELGGKMPPYIALPK
jgi:hypothetical protein